MARLTLLFGALAATAGASGAPKTFVVDLAKAPKDRWVEVAAHYKDILPGIIHAFSTKVVHKLPAPTQIGFIQSSNIPEEHKGELHGIVNATGSAQVTTEKLMLFNLMYELTAFPGGAKDMGAVVAKPNGEVLHGRNYQMNLPFELPDGSQANLKDYACEVTFMAYDKPLVTSVHYPGQIGIHTAMRFDGWSVEMTGDGQGNNIAKNLAAAKQGALPSSFAIRRIVEGVKLLSQAMRRLETTQFMAPQLITLAGKDPSAGTTLRMQRNVFSDRLPYPNAVALSKSMGRWFITASADEVAQARTSPSVNLLLESMSHDRPVDSKMTEDSMLAGFRAQADKDTSFTWVACPATGFHVMQLNKDPLAMPKEKVASLLQTLRFLK